MGTAFRASVPDWLTWVAGSTVTKPVGMLPALEHLSGNPGVFRPLEHTNEISEVYDKVWSMTKNLIVKK